MLFSPFDFLVSVYTPVRINVMGSLDTLYGFLSCPTILSVIIFLIRKSPDTIFSTPFRTPF